jgi:hypothetical protein
MFMGRDYVSKLLPPTGLLFILQIIHEYGEPWWDDIDRRKPKNSEKDLCHFVHHTFYMEWPGREPGLPQ